MNINVTGGQLDTKEIDAYIEHIYKNNPHKQLKMLNINIDGDYVDLTYILEPMPFERIRRITGYLVGSVDRFNNAKRSEVKDRVKHL